MRIIAGEFRGRRLLDPADRSTRPITDRVKQRIFDVLGDRLTGAMVFDVFAGTGSFGLESLSRGAQSVVFFERHRPAVARLRLNIESLGGVADRCRVVTQDVFRWAASSGAEAAHADVIFFDPPYPFVQDRPRALAQLLEDFSGQLNNEGRIVFRIPVSSTFAAPLPVRDERKWGSMRVQFLGSVASEPE